MLETKSGATRFSGSIFGGPLYLCRDFVHRLLRQLLLQLLPLLPPSLFVVLSLSLWLDDVVAFEKGGVFSDTLQFCSFSMSIRMFGERFCVPEVDCGGDIVFSIGKIDAVPWKIDFGEIEKKRKIKSISIRICG